MTAPADLVPRVLRGEQAAIGRMITLVERRADGVNEALATLHRETGRAHVLGITGPPGSGKSTLVSALTAAYRSSGATVGVIAVDPSSVFSGGAILGDRIRMGTLAGDDGVFIRSLATRGALGGLSRAALDTITVLDAAGKDVIILETVGVGQAEVDVISAADSVAVVSVPGLGDGVQALKAGLLEIADLHVVNKADREGADRTVAELREMLRLVRRPPGEWKAPIQKTVATDGQGIPELIARFGEHLCWATTSGERERRARSATATRIRWLAEEFVLNQLKPGVADFDRAVEDVAARRFDPVSAAEALLRDL